MAAKKGGDDELFDLKQAEFIRIIAEGGTWKRAEKELKVSSATISKWLASDEEFEKRYARAKEACADALFNEMLDIADDGSNDWMQRNHGETVSWVENGEALRRSQLRIETRKWMAGKLRPKVYGEKIQTELSGPDNGPIVVTWQKPEGL